MTSRRAFLLGIGSALAAPAIVRAESIMKVRALALVLPASMPLMVVPPVEFNVFDFIVGPIIKRWIDADGILRVESISPQDFFDAPLQGPFSLTLGDVST